MIRVNQKIAGFTLIEILVYLAIFLIITTASIGFMISLDDFIDEYRLETALYRSGTGAMEQILLALRQADNVDLANTILNSPSNGRLTVENSVGTKEFLFIVDELQFILDGDNLGDLTGTDVVVDDFTVYHYSTGDGELVRVKITLTGTIDSVSKTIKLYGGSVIRGAV